MAKESNRRLKSWSDLNLRHCPTISIDESPPHACESVPSEVRTSRQWRSKGNTLSIISKHPSVFEFTSLASSQTYSLSISAFSRITIAYIRLSQFNAVEGALYCRDTPSQCVCAARFLKTARSPRTLLRFK